MLSSTYLSAKLVKKDIFHVNITRWALYFLNMHAGHRSDFLVVLHAFLVV